MTDSLTVDEKFTLHLAFLKSSSTKVILPNLEKISHDRGHGAHRGRRLSLLRDLCCLLRWNPHTTRILAWYFVPNSAHVLDHSRLALQADFSGLVVRRLRRSSRNTSSRGQANSGQVSKTVFKCQKNPITNQVCKHATSRLINGHRGEARGDLFHHRGRASLNLDETGRLWKARVDEVLSKLFANRFPGFAIVEDDLRV
jgi:hypothetical protein